MNAKPRRLRQVMDWKAATWAGIVAGAVFLLFNVFISTRFLGGNGWMAFRYAASIVLGERVLPPPASFDLTAFVLGILVNFVISIAAALLIAAVLHRWGLLVGICGGAVFGLALYVINFYTLTLLFPWFFVLRSPTLLVAHVIFGALAGGVYEALEVEEFVVVE